MATLIPTPKRLEKALAYVAGEDYSAYAARSKQAFDALMAESDAVPEGQVKGRVILFPYADGHAIYKVVSEKPLKLFHVPYGDAWHIGDFAIRGLRLPEVQARVR